MTAAPRQAAESDQGCFARNISRYFRNSLATGTRGNIDNPPILTHHHARQNFTAAKHGPAQIHLLALPPMVRVILPERTDGTARPGIVHEQADVPESLFYLTHHLPYRVGGRHVGGYSENSTAFVLSYGGLELIGGPRRDGDCPPLLRQTERNALSNTPPTTSDQSNHMAPLHSAYVSVHIKAGRQLIKNVPFSRLSVGQSSRACKPPYLYVLPRNLRPMRLSRRPEPFASDDYIFELKIDGFRALAYIENGQCDLV
jgi:hypothetical protein